MNVKKVALLTAGGLAPCLSSSVGRLIERYNEVSENIEIIAYIGGYKGLLTGDSIIIDKKIRENISILYNHGGSPIGNSRVKLTNIVACQKRGLVQKGQTPLAAGLLLFQQDLFFRSQQYLSVLLDYFQWGFLHDYTKCLYFP